VIIPTIRVKADSSREHERNFIGIALNRGFQNFNQPRSTRETQNESLSAFALAQMPSMNALKRTLRITLNSEDSSDLGGVCAPGPSNRLSLGVRVEPKHSLNPAGTFASTASSSFSSPEVSRDRPTQTQSVWATWLLLLAVFFAVQVASLFTPPLLDDVDSAHAQAAQHFAETGDWVTMKINGIRYIEKPPLPYWFVGISYKIFGESAASTHLPNALAMLGLCWLSWAWARRAWGDRAALYAGLAVLTGIGPFLFTRFIIPESYLALFLLWALYGLITGLELGKPTRFYWCYIGVALATMTKGLIAPVFFIGAAVPYLLLTGQWRRWKEIKPITGPLLFLAIAAPWHILCGLANPDQGHALGSHPTVGNVHGFFYFYFVNEHLLRFFSLRYPHDYNKLPYLAYWLLHLVWLSPWSLFVPAVLAVAWKTRRGWLQQLGREAGNTVDFYIDNAAREKVASYVTHIKFQIRTVWLLSLYSAWTLLFFSLSSNQEYYTFPVWPALFILIAAVVAAIEEQRKGVDGQPLLSTAWLTWGNAVFAVVAVLAAATLGWGLWDSRNLPFVSDIGTVLARRSVADYTLSMSHFFDLTGASFAALRLPASLAAIALLIGPPVGWWLRVKKKHIAATISVGLTSAVFLIAAHIALARFEPILSSKRIADTILQKGTPADTFIDFGDQSDASSVMFYTHHFFNRRPALLVYPRCGQHGEGSTLLWGSCYPDAPDVFLSEEKLAQMWGTGERHWLFAQGINQQKAEGLLAGRLYLVQNVADKALWTDRPLPKEDMRAK
jgi:4-amino-4-deoxy-L-arabinose transferase-like glycosyltransferase